MKSTLFVITLFVSILMCHFTHGIIQTEHRLNKKLCENELEFNVYVREFCDEKSTAAVAFCSRFLKKFLESVKFMSNLEDKCLRFLEMERQMRRMGLLVRN